MTFFDISFSSAKISISVSTAPPFTAGTGSHPGDNKQILGFNTKPPLLYPLFYNLLASILFSKKYFVRFI